MQRHEIEPPTGKKPNGWTTTRWLLFVIACLTGMLVAKVYEMWGG
nr:MetaGeneMark_Unknown Function [uncultured bacterium]